MKQIEYEMVVRNVDKSSIWVENNGGWVEDNITIVQHAQAAVNQFNKYLESGEKEREFLMARPVHVTNTVIKHSWKKVSLVTEKGGYDKYKCAYCPATGKRYGVTSGIIPDKGYTVFCTTINLPPQR